MRKLIFNLCVLTLIVGCWKEENEEQTSFTTGGSGAVSLHNNNSGSKEKAKLSLTASVVLHQEESPYKNITLEVKNISTGQVHSAITDGSGKVFFSLDAGSYRIETQSPMAYDELSKKSQKERSFSLAPGEILQKNITYEKGICSFELYNSSSNSYDVYVDNQPAFVMVGGTSIVMRNVVKGEHSVRVLQRAGYLFYPTERNLSLEVDCTEKMLSRSFP